MGIDKFLVGLQLFETVWLGVETDEEITRVVGGRDIGLEGRS